jgi:beta-lactamase class D
MKFDTSVKQLCDSLFQKQTKHLLKEALKLQTKGQILLCQNLAKSNLKFATQLVKIVQEEPLAMAAL